jgi:16S rRNA (uracil1498-N3)-methyltransferase
MRFADFLSQQQPSMRFIAHCEEDEKMDLKRRVAPDKDVVVLIGPEGDFTREEIQAAYGQGFLPVSLGESRLRTETAALVACATVNLINSG